MITYGQACCLVLDLEPTKENRKRAKETLAQVSLGATYLENNGHLEPIALSESKIGKNPYKYRRYPSTPPSSPVSSDIEDTVSDEVEQSSVSSSSSEEDAAPENYSTQGILKMAKLLFTKDNIDTTDLYDKKWLTTQDIFTSLAIQLPRLSSVMTTRQLGLLLSKHHDHFGSPIRKRVNGKFVHCRELFHLKECGNNVIEDDYALFLSHIRASDGDWVNVGYVRKSPGEELPSTRARLITCMAERLKKRCHCRKIFVSDGSTANEPILARDADSGPTSYDGNTQDMFSYFTTKSKKIRLCVIDYAGFSTDPDDIQKTMKLTRSIKELVVLHPHRIEMFTRMELKQESILTKFKCRTGPVHRSKYSGVARNRSSFV
ncbi:uncharacterized protein BYT42DRAFT_565236 [Radiomyces spectabilis]|uniref:uncharacterized protein n=1 Tax=Radiomyces spectabilis TaxID=64574 RepID=UPI00221EC174|nr:uncharacterized protein BYT42DRAFT_565236 [Radiomyces spectabilis]KAI8381099.1 hypothetical protein BYT42DRAFT_565236 [Radiomyces spectabilis]